ncbi:MAG TPA: hypothetical protein VGI22_05190 [Xanthobacteraceae bacterium]
MTEASDNVFPQSSPRRHLLSDNHPRPLATLAQHCVELGATQGDGATIGEGQGTARRFDRGHQGTFGSQIRFDQGCDIVHATTICSGRPDSQ